MKRCFTILLCVLMLLSFCGCMQPGLHATGTTTETTESTTPAPTRETHIQLEFFLEGMQEFQAATLFVGEGYSLYITDDNWIEAPGEKGAVTWTSGYNPDITLTVIPNAGADRSLVKEALFAGYTCFDESGEYIFGRNGSGLYYRAARLIETPNGVLAAVWNYSLEAAEGFGARLYVIAGTLEDSQ